MAKRGKGGTTTASNKDTKSQKSNRNRLRMRVQRTWTRWARNVNGRTGDGAARVTLFNDVDDEEVPLSLTGVGRFRYLEDQYELGPNLPFLVFRVMPTIRSKGQGFFNFKYGPREIVVECNPYCACSTSCRNRVSQRPRQTPMQVFKTQTSGWAVRSPVPVRRGTVLGFFTGSLMLVYFFLLHSSVYFPM
ncbi:hypothetical protein R3P38DRAFT_2770619 [Favolaschia claudopus]|uniref:Post-SET domain-containing protein n=1 Tax=Favolaschia claudopus TaxID=2862362 RepID=A0AAW0CHP9_9AGAR